MNREDFVMLDQDIVYFDNGATTLKPKRVVDSFVNYYTKHTSNIHRGDYDAAVVTNDLYDSTREVVKNFINCNNSNEVIFTSGTTMSINMVVFGFMRKYLLPKEGSFYKANLHCHTTLSDGKMTPQEVKDYYLKNRYNIVALPTTQSRSITNNSFQKIFCPLRDLKQHGLVLTLTQRI